MGAGTQVGSLYSSLTLESSSFISGIKEAVDQTAKSSRAIEGSLNVIRSGVLLAFGSISVAAITATIGRALEFAGALNSVSKQLGVTTTDLQIYRYAADQVGVSQANMESGLQNFTKALGDARAGVVNTRAVFKEIGFTDADIDKLDQHEALMKTADGLAQVRDRATRAAPELKLFGSVGQQLDPLLAGGSAAINDLAKAAADLGLVLTPEQIENADRAASKFAELKKVLEANIASAVANNAESLLHLAEALERVAVAAAHALTSMDVNGNMSILNNPTLVKLSSYLTGNDPAKVKQGAIDSLIGTHEGRDKLFNQTRDQLRALDRGDTFSLGIADNPGAIAQMRSELLGLRQRIVVAEQKSRAGAAGGTADAGGKGYTDPASAAAAERARLAAARAAERDRQAALRRDERGADELARTNDEYLSLRERLTTDAREQARLQHLQVDDASSARDIGIDRDVAEKQITAAAGEELKHRGVINDQLKHAAINRELDAKLDREDLDIKLGAIGDRRDLLSAQSALARTAGDRRDLELRLLDLQHQEERLREQAIIDSRDSTASQKATAQARLDILPQLQQLDRERVSRKNASPGQQYLDGLIQSAGEAKEAIEQIEADGLRSLNDGIADAITGTKSLGDVFKNVSNQIISDLVRIAVQKSIIGPLANSLFGGLGGSSGYQSVAGAGWGTDLSSVSSLSLPDLHFATGGGFKVGGTGGPDSKLFNMALSPGEAVEVTHGESDGRRGGTTVHQTINVEGGVDLATRTEVYRLANATHAAALSAIDDKSRRRG